MNHNHSKYQHRLDFVRHLTQERFQLKVCDACAPPAPRLCELLSKNPKDDDVDITPIEYDPESPFKYNNFVYRLTLHSPIVSGNENETAHQPGCVPVPAGTTELILRLANPDTEGMNKQNRVENEVATIQLVSNALALAGLKIVPSVYGWGSASGESSQGWILQQYMPGTPLDAVFDKLDLDGKKSSCITNGNDAEGDARISTTGRHHRFWWADL